MATTTTTTCDHCARVLQGKLKGFFGGPPNSLSTQALQVPISIPPEHQRAFRDFCNEHCLRDYLIAHLPSPAQPSPSLQVSA